MLVSNMERVITLHMELLARLEGEGEKESVDQRVGGVFLTMAADLMCRPHKLYCSHHPKAVSKMHDHE